MLEALLTIDIHWVVAKTQEGAVHGEISIFWVQLV